MSEKGKKSDPILAIMCPKRGTKAAEGFYQSLKQANRFYHFILHLVGHSDSTAEHAHKTLVETEDDESKKQEMIQAWSKRVSATQTLRQNRQFFLEMIFVRHVENFLSYLSSLLYEIFTQRPETLRSSDKVEVASVLRHDSVESIIRELAERKVEALSYTSFRDLSEFFTERFGVQIATSDEVQQIAEAIEVRNISAHNRCVINRRYITRLSLSEDLMGKKREIYLSDLEKIVLLLSHSVKSIDRRAASKLKLRGVRFKWD